MQSLHWLVHTQVFFDRWCVFLFDCIIFHSRNNGTEIEPRFDLFVNSSAHEHRPDEIPAQFEFERQQQQQQQQLAPMSLSPVSGSNQVDSTQSFTGSGQSSGEQFQPMLPVHQQKMSPRQLSPSHANYNSVQPPNSPSPIGDNRVFGSNPRIIKISPSRLSNRADSISDKSVSPVPNIRNYIQSVPTTPTIGQQNHGFSFDQSDFNNNPPGGDNNRKVYGLPSRTVVVKSIAPIGNHGVQPISNEQKYFGLSGRQRFNSLTSERDWKSPLPIVNIPNTDQLLPSHTKQLGTYINQTPPTEKFLRPSLASLERRRIRPVWPPPHPGRASNRAFAEGRGRIAFL